MDVWPYIIRYVLFATPIAILIISSFRYMKKEKSSDAILLFSGSTLAFLSYTAYIFCYKYYIESVEFNSNIDAETSINNMIFYSNLTTISLIAGVVGMFLFAFGFLMFSRKYLKQRREVRDELDQIGKQ